MHSYRRYWKQFWNVPLPKLENEPEILRLQPRSLRVQERRPTREASTEETGRPVPACLCEQRKEEQHRLQLRSDQTTGTTTTTKISSATATRSAEILPDRTAPAAKAANAASSSTAGPAVSTTAATAIATEKIPARRRRQTDRSRQSQPELNWNRHEREQLRPIQLKQLGQAYSKCGIQTYGETMIEFYNRNCSECSLSFLSLYFFNFYFLSIIMSCANT